MRVAIVGLGASGLMAASIASKNNDVYVYEKNEKAGKKLFITGKGRCNMTNACDIFDFKKNIVTNSKFLSHSLSVFNNIDLIDFFEKNGLKTKIERGNRVYPYDDKAYRVTDCFMNIINKNKVKINYKHEVCDIVTKDNVAIAIKVKDIKNNEIKEIQFDKIIICTGGMSYQLTGSTGDGYKFAKKLDINTTNIYPALVPLKIKESDEIKSIEGLLLKNVSIKITNNENKILYKDFGDMMCRDGYLDGPIIISASSFIVDKINQKLTIHINLKPALDVEKLNQRLIRDIKDKNKESLRTELESLLPISLIDSFIIRLNNMLKHNESEIEYLSNKSISNMTKEERNTIISLLKDYKYEIVGTKSIDSAIVTKGGIDIKEINPKNMESKKIKNLYFVGEVLDLDALTGGFNLSIAFITGYIASMSI